MTSFDAIQSRNARASLADIPDPSNWEQIKWLLLSHKSCVVTQPQRVQWASNFLDNDRRGKCRMLQDHRGRVTKATSGDDSIAWDDSKDLLESNILFKDLGVSQTLGHSGRK